MHTERSYEILEQTLSIVSLANPLVAAIQRKDRDAEECWFFNHSSASSKDHDLASQVRRALSSVGLNLAEVSGTAAGNDSWFTAAPTSLRAVAEFYTAIPSEAGLRLPPYLGASRHVATGHESIALHTFATAHSVSRVQCSTTVVVAEFEVDEQLSVPKPTAATQIASHS